MLHRITFINESLINIWSEIDNKFAKDHFLIADFNFIPKSLFFSNHKFNNKFHFDLCIY